VNARSAAAVPAEVVTRITVGVVVRLKFALAPRVDDPAVSVPAPATNAQAETSEGNVTLYVPVAFFATLVTPALLSTVPLALTIAQFVIPAPAGPAGEAP